MQTMWINNGKLWTTRESPNVQGGRLDGSPHQLLMSLLHGHTQGASAQARRGQGAPVGTSACERSNIEVWWVKLLYLKSQVLYQSLPTKVMLSCCSKPGFERAQVHWTHMATYEVGSTCSSSLGHFGFGVSWIFWMPWGVLVYHSKTTNCLVVEPRLNNI